MIKTIGLFSVAVLVACVTSAPAALITPTAVTASSQFTSPDRMIDGSGLDEFGLHDNNENNMWQTFNLDTETSIGETAEFILDQNYDLSEAVIWQYNGLNGFGLPELDRELDEIELSVSSGLTGDFTSIGTFNMAPAFDQLSNVGEPAQLFALTGATNVRRVLLTINSVQGGVDDGTAGLSEVRFNGVVPEPNTFIGLILGVGVLISSTRRRWRT